MNITISNLSLHSHPSAKPQDPPSLDSLDHKLSPHAWHIIETAIRIASVPRGGTTTGIATSEDLLAAILATHTKNGSKSFARRFLEKHFVTLETLCHETGLHYAEVAIAAGSVIGDDRPVINRDAKEGELLSASDFVSQLTIGQHYGMTIPEPHLQNFMETFPTLPFNRSTVVFLKSLHEGFANVTIPNMHIEAKVPETWLHSIQPSPTPAANESRLDRAFRILEIYNRTGSIQNQWRAAGFTTSEWIEAVERFKGQGLNDDKLLDAMLLTLRAAIVAETTWTEVVEKPATVSECAGCPKCGIKDIPPGQICMDLNCQFPRPL